MDIFHTAPVRASISPIDLLAAAVSTPGPRSQVCGTAKEKEFSLEDNEIWYGMKAGPAPMGLGSKSVHIDKEPTQVEPGEPPTNMA